MRLKLWCFLGAQGSLELMIDIEIHFALCGNLLISVSDSLSRTDQVMVKIVEKMGGRAASDGFTSNSEISVVRVAKKYENYVRISEYDGSETPWVDRKKYLLDQLRRVLAEEDTNCEGKVKVMRRLFDEEPFESDDDYDEYF
jgi:hypothetical protein